MQPKTVFIVVAVVGLINGMFNPVFLQLVLGLMPFWLPDFVTPSLSLVFFFSSLLLSVATLLISGIPAALYERVTGAQTSTTTSMIIWLASALLLTLPAFPMMVSLI